MPTEIIRLDDLVPDDIEFEWKGVTYSVPGDLSTEQRFLFAKLFRDLSAAEVTSIEAQHALQNAESAAAQKKARATLDTAEAAQAKLTEKIEAALLTALQVCQPELKTLPWGTAGSQALLLLVMVRLAGGPDDQENPPGNRAQRRATARKKSKRSSSSRRS